MKVRDSGMPEEGMWSGFFEPDVVLKTMGLRSDTGPVLDLGCGYGTFTIPAARITRSAILAMDIEPEMIAEVERKALTEGLQNSQPILRDFCHAGTGLEDGSMAYVMLFNILHAEDPVSLLREAYRVLHKRGKVAIIHWNYDQKTPRGPAMEIRPTPEQCRDWAAEAGFKIDKFNIALQPHHYGIIAGKK
jgi:ubiquinone/menaquinone biosynthesis C-methylase UbiE